MMNGWMDGWVVVEGDDEKSDTIDGWVCEKGGEKGGEERERGRKMWYGLTLQSGEFGGRFVGLSSSKDVVIE